MSDSTYKTGVYVKGDRTRNADTVSEAVALLFEGFRLVEAPKAEVVVDETEVETAPVPTAPKTTNKN